MDTITKANLIQSWAEQLDWEEYESAHQSEVADLWPGCTVRDCAACVTSRCYRSSSNGGLSQRLETGLRVKQMGWESETADSVTWDEVVSNIESIAREYELSCITNAGW